MSQNGQHALPLIMMRELAENLATPVFLVDGDGSLVYYNEAAEQLLGLRYAEAGSLSAEQWGELWAAEDLDGNPLPLDARPISIAMKQGRPSHRPMILVGKDGARRTIEVTTFPLLAQANNVVGAVAIFWDRVDGAT
jgi:PAS domain S-box-containing protein